MKSIKIRLVIVYLALVFIVMIVSGTFMLAGVRLSETNIAKKELKSYATLIDDQVIKVYEDFTEFKEHIVDVEKTMSGMQGNILNSSGEMIASTSSIKAQYNNNSAIISAINGTIAYNTWKKDQDTSGQWKEWIDCAYPVINEEDGKVLFVIFTRIDVQSINDNMDNFTNTLVLTLILALFLTAILGYVFAKTLTEPIIILTKGAKEMAQGNLNQEMIVYSNDEIGQLTESFNNMATELNSTMSTMESEKNKMEILLHNMTDGVLAYTNNGLLIHANNAARELLSFNDFEEISFSEMMERLEVEIKDISSLTIEILKETTIIIGDKYINASFAPYLNKYGAIQGIVIVLQDITRHKKLDNMRKEFVANVSHEIRTPLTTIKSYTETLLDGAMEDKETALDFLSTIDSETDRMALLATDLLELSRFDNKQISLEMARADLIEILVKCIKQTSILAENKKQKVIFESGSRKCMVVVDSARINQVFTNIISNAIKYSSEHTTIEISVEETDRYYRIYIKDHGMGIPKEDIHRIFERFYRVDKARSRAMGGTGLGLAIAEEIMEAHNGKIMASSELNKGTTMILRFNKA